MFCKIIGSSTLDLLKTTSSIIIPTHEAIIVFALAMVPCVFFNGSVAKYAYVNAA